MSISLHFQSNVLRMCRKKTQFFLGFSIERSEKRHLLCTKCVCLCSLQKPMFSTNQSFKIRKSYLINDAQNEWVNGKKTHTQEIFNRLLKTNTLSTRCIIISLHTKRKQRSSERLWFLVISFDKNYFFYYFKRKECQTSKQTTKKNQTKTTPHA